MRIAVVLLIFLLSACDEAWIRVEAGATELTGNHFSTRLPTGWVKLEQKQEVVATLDGIDIQQIAVSFSEADDAFDKIDGASAEDMLAAELASLYVANLKAADESGLPSLDILKTQPVEVDHRPGFELHLQYVDQSGLRYQMLVSGVATESGFYTISYRAPVLHFFERDREAYRQVVDAFRWR